MYSRLHVFFLILILEKKIKRLISEQKWLSLVSFLSKSEKSTLRFFHETKERKFHKEIKTR